MEGGVEEGWVIEFGAVAGLFSGNGLEARGEGFVPLEGERGYVGEDAVELVEGDVAGQRDGVEAGSADGGVGAETVDGVGGLGPALGGGLVFHDRDHEAGEADLFDGHCFRGGAVGTRGGEGGAGAV